MDPIRLLVRAKQIVRHPPPMWKVKLIFGVIAVAILLASIEWIWGWPDWLTVNNMRAKP